MAVSSHLRPENENNQTASIHHGGQMVVHDVPGLGRDCITRFWKAATPSCSFVLTPDLQTRSFNAMLIMREVSTKPLLTHCDS